MPSFVDVQTVAAPLIAPIATSDTASDEERPSSIDEDEPQMVSIVITSTEDVDFFEAQAKKRPKKSRQTVATRAKKR
jgi:hypothetical protein